MRIVVNGQSETIEEATTVGRLLLRYGLQDKPCAVEVNRRVVPRPEVEGHVLEDGDAVEIVTLVGGG